MRPWKTAACAVCVTLAASSLVFFYAASAGASAQNAPIELRNPYMDWLDVVEEGATYEWTVDVTNHTANTVRLRIILDLIDDDDHAVNRDEQGNPFDVVIITLEPGEPPAAVVVKQQGIISYDLAAEVVSYTIRHRIIQ